MQVRLRRDHLMAHSVWPRPLILSRATFESVRTLNMVFAAIRRQSVHSSLAGYDDTNDAERMALDPT